MATAESKSEIEEKKELPSEKKLSEDAETGAPVIKEKIVYKVVHVPYYYPVPVDAEYYYQNQDRFLRNRDRYDERIFDHLPPPPHPYGHHSRRSRDHFHKEVFPDEFNGSRSPSPSIFEPRYIRARSPSSSPGQPRKASESSSKNIEEEEKIEEKIKREKEESPEAVNSPASPNEPIAQHSPLQQGFEINNKSTAESTDSLDKQSNSSHEANERESHVEEKHRNRRKRYLMTFPYDQKNKESSDAGSKKEFFNSGFKKFRSEVVHASSDYPLDIESRRYNDIPHKRSSHYYMSHPPSPSRTPYVMVPMRPIGVPSPDYIHERRFKEHSQYRSQKRRDSDTEKDISESSGSKPQTAEEFDQESKDVRYHSNGRRVRTVFSRQQLLTLNNVFQKHPFVSGERMSELSKQLGLDRKIVKIWFQNKRQNARKKGSLFERADEYYCEQGSRKKSFERSEDYYFEYPQDRYSNRSSPPTMAENW